MNILGIHYGHNATVALSQNGRIVFAMSEERLNRLKNSNGFPVLVLDYIYKNLIRPEEVDAAVIFQKDIAGYLDMKNRGFKSARNFGIGNINFGRAYSFKNHLFSKISGFWALRSKLGRFRHMWWEKTLRAEAMQYFVQSLKLPQEKILFCGHHEAHAYACGFNLEPTRKTLVFTMDGEGDGLSSTVNVFQNYNLETLSANPVNVSIGYFFTEITKLLGMTPNEHEFKVMGLAPYAKQEKARELYEKFKDLITLDENLQFKSQSDTRRLEYFLLEKLYGQRFDTIAAMAQIFLETKVLEWVKAWVKKTGVSDLALGGGVFMSVKLNQKILELPEVNSVFVMPSAADESTAIGACAFGNIQLAGRAGQAPKLAPFTDLYWGREYENAEIEKVLKEGDCYERHSIEKFEGEFELERKIAALLSENQVVARMKGRSEWGARALGNRSILANPQSRDTVRIINEMIKNRDFWMPFAASVLEEDVARYFINPKNIFAPYMAITFETTELARRHLTSAIHPYDFSCRPQVVTQSYNPSYYALISEFKKITGIGGILNTSFNLHGEPNVENPTDALRTLEDSGLKYLALGNFLISKE